MENRDELVARWVLAAEQSERFAVEVLSGLAPDAGSCPEISDCLRQQQRNARRQVERLRLFLGDDIAPTLEERERVSFEGEAPAADSGAGSDSTRAMEVSYSLQKLQCALYQRLLEIAEAAGDVELASLCRETVWIKDAMATRVKCGSAGSLGNGSASGQGVPNSVSLLPGLHGVEIRHGARGLEVLIPLSTEEDPQSAMQSVLSQVWAQLAEAIGDAESSLTQPAASKTNATGRRQGRSLPPDSGAWWLS